MRSHKIDQTRSVSNQLKPLRVGVPAAIKGTLEKMITLSEKIEKAQKELNGHPEKLPAALKLSQDYGKAATAWAAWGQKNCTTAP